MKQPAAVLGVGQTRHRSKRTDVSIAGLCREAADRALLDAGGSRWPTSTRWWSGRPRTCSRA